MLLVSLIATVPGFQAPESVFWDAASRTWFVSNVVGKENEKDGRGWISRLDASGRIRKARWIEGLDSPHGIRVHAGTLYAADVDRIVVIDVAKVRIRERISAPGAKFLNDVAVTSAGDVYVSDTLGDAIYRCRSACEIFVKSDSLQGPTGLLVDGDRLIVATWGPITDPITFATRTPGRLISVDLKTKEIAPLGEGKPIGNLDGIEKDGADYLVTDFMAGKIFRVSKSGAATVLKSGFAESADLGWDPARRTIAVPETSGGTVKFFRLPR
ncbi:MAG TPA: ATP/GTP-binding protein [Thermoanaerobaculia bacterium]|nr:ATP/GTP-binding protein [Thermoanaerobaculia bacterium]